MNPTRFRTIDGRVVQHRPLEDPLEVLLRLEASWSRRMKHWCNPENGNIRTSRLLTYKRGRDN